jgi:hypothetical protein
MKQASSGASALEEACTLYFPPFAHRPSPFFQSERNEGRV